MRTILIWIFAPIVLVGFLLLALWVLGKKLLSDAGENIGQGAGVALSTGVTGLASGLSSGAKGWWDSLKEQGKQGVHVAPKIQRLQEIPAGSLWDQGLKGTVPDEGLQDNLSFIQYAQAKVNAGSHLSTPERNRLNNFVNDLRIYGDKETWNVVTYTIGLDMTLLCTGVV